jgi:uncharacterized protein YutE (UPF0331/DUF86 family)
VAEDVVYGKVATIERCLERITDDYVGHESAFETEFMRQDAIVLNLLRACEAAIDLAMHVVRARRLGLPERSRDAFDLLERAALLDHELADRMRAMVGLRNVAIHAYQTLDLAIVRAVIERHLDDFSAFARAVLALESGEH